MKDQLIFACNEAINYNPIVLTFGFFKVIQEESNIKGYWKDESGNLYIDNIQKIRVPFIRKDLLEVFKRQAFADGELAVLYKNPYNEAVIEDRNGKAEVLKNQIHIKENVRPSDEYIKLLLENANGLTVYEIEEDNFLIEIYK